MNFFSVIINEDTWNIYIIEDADNVIADEDNAAETDFAKKEVYFRKGDFDLVDVRHELWHVFFGYTFTRTTEMDHHQTEEVSAELFAARGERISSLSTEVYNKLLEMRDKEQS